MAATDSPAVTTTPAKDSRPPRAAKLAWPAGQADRTRAVQQALAAAAAPLTPAQVAAQFQRAQVATIEKILDALCSLGLARRVRGKFMV